MRPKKLPRTPKKLLFLLLFLLVTILYQKYFPEPPKVNSENKAPLIATSEAQMVFVTKVIDGDTIEIETGQKIRYIGIDTPELHHPTKSVQCFAEEAKKENQRLVEGKQITIKKDVSDTDRYGRLLRYVYIEEKNATPSSVFINDYLVKEGYAYAATFPPDILYREVFSASQVQARNSQKGLWAQCAE